MGSQCAPCAASDLKKQSNSKKFDAEEKTEEQIAINDSNANEENQLISDDKDKEEKYGYGSKADQSSYYVSSKYRNKTDLKEDGVYASDREEYIKNLSDETKKCIAATHLFASIWKSYFTDSENQCEYIDYNNKASDDVLHFNILDHVLVRGGCTRDVLWKVDFNDIDAAVNTRELNKLHLLHLKKFHSTKETQENSKCILWLQYAKKFDNDTFAAEKESDFKDDETGAKIIKSVYMLNAKFLLEILENDERVQNKLSVAIMGRTKRVWNIRIIDTLMYKGYDLKGFDFDFLDIKHGIFALKEEKEEKEERAKAEQLHTMRAKTLLNLGGNNNLLAVGGGAGKDKYRAMYSIRVQSNLKLFQNVADKDYTAKPIDLPIYPLVFVNMSKWTDLTVNSMIIHMSDVIKDQFGEFTHLKEGKVDYDWRPKVRNPSFEIDGITDCKQKRIAVWGSNKTDTKEVLKVCHPKFHLFRTCKMWIKLKGKGNLDLNLKDATIQLYPLWFTIDKIENDENFAKEMAKRIIHDYAKKGTYILRFEFFEEVQFNEICKDIMENVNDFKQYIIDEIDNIEDEEEKKEIKTEMNKWGYNV